MSDFAAVQEIGGRRPLKWVFEELTNAAQVLWPPCLMPTYRGFMSIPTVGETQSEYPETLQSSPVDVGQAVNSESGEMVARIEQQLAADAEYAADSQSAVPTKAAKDICLTLAERLAPHVVLAPQLKAGAFVEDEGGISLVLQSLVTDRRVNYRIPRQGGSLTVIQIDERMVAKSTTVSLDDRSATREFAKWVTTRA